MKTERKRTKVIDLQRLLSTRKGIMTVAAVAAVLAGAILLVFLSAYRNGLTGGGDAKTVLVAKQLIPKGAPAEVIAADGMYQTATIDEDKVEDGAIADPDAIKDQYASKSIFPGEQLRPEDFQANADGFASRLSEYERAMAVPVDNHHGMIGELRAGDRVDVLGFYGLSAGDAQRAVVRTLLQDVLVFKAPEEREDGVTDQQEVYIKVPDDRAAEIVAHAADTGRIWITLRPTAGAKQHRPSITTIERILFGMRGSDVTVSPKQLRKVMGG